MRRVHALLLGCGAVHLLFQWLQWIGYSQIYALTKGFFLAHFVQILPVSSGFDPKPIKPAGGFQFNSKGFESGHLLCLQHGSSEHNRDHGTPHVGLNQVSTLHDGGKGVDLLLLLGFCLLGFFCLIYKTLCLRQSQFSFPAPPFFTLAKGKQCLAAWAGERQPRACACGRQAPWRPRWHIIPTYGSMCLSSPPLAASAPPWQAWPVSMVTVGPAGCRWRCHLPSPRPSRVRNRSAAPPSAAQNGSVQGRQAHARNYTVIIKWKQGFKEKAKAKQCPDCGFPWWKEEGDAWLGMHPLLPPSSLGAASSGEAERWTGELLLCSGLDSALGRNNKRTQLLLWETGHTKLKWAQGCCSLTGTQPGRDVHGHFWGLLTVN